MMLHKKSNRTSLLKLFALVPIVGITLALNARTVTDYVYDGPQKQEPVKKGKKNTTIKVGNQEIQVKEISKPDTNKQPVQWQVDQVNNEKVYDVPETMPEFPGGAEALIEYLRNNIKWPDEESCVQGRVIVSFVVEKDGSISNAKVVKSVHPAFDAEALRVVNGMPKWTPGKQNGKPVNAKYVVPVTFKSDHSTPAKNSYNVTGSYTHNEATGTFNPNESKFKGSVTYVEKEKKANNLEDVVAVTKGLRFFGNVDPNDIMVYVDDKVVETEKLNEIDPKSIERINIGNDGKDDSKKYIRIYTKKQ